VKLLFARITRFVTSASFDADAATLPGTVLEHSQVPETIQQH
jgi:hypothetical protein